MPDKMRHRFGAVNAVDAAVDADTVIEIGDLVWQDVDDAKPASAFPLLPLPERSEVRREVPGQIAQRDFASTFLGVAMQRSREGDTDPIRVATTGVFEFDCEPDTFELGDLVAPRVSDSHGLALWNQKVVKVTDPKRAIGRVAKRVPDPATTVLMDVRSTVMTGGVAGSSPSGV